MDKESLKQKILEAKDQHELSQYQIIDFLPDSMRTRNLICFVEDSKKKSYTIKFSTNKAIEKEYNIMKEIQHPNIMHAHHFIESNNFYGFVMPKAEGGDLLEQFSNSALLQSDIRHVMKSLLSALQFLHEYGIMHRDVKIENLLVMGKTVSSEIVLSDFEFATSDQFSKDLFGVPDFIAPEMFRGQMCMYFFIFFLFQYYILKYPNHNLFYFQYQTFSILYKKIYFVTYQYLHFYISNLKCTNDINHDL